MFDYVKHRLAFDVGLTPVTINHEYAKCCRPPDLLQRRRLPIARRGCTTSKAIFGILNRTALTEMNSRDLPPRHRPETA